MEILTGQALYQLGLFGAGISAALGILVSIVFIISGKRLKKKLEDAYGKKRR